MAKTAQRVDIDLSEVESVDGGTMALLVHIRGELSARGIDASFSGASKSVDALNISLSYTDPSSMFRYWHSTSYSPTNQNWGHWSTPQLAIRPARLVDALEIDQGEGEKPTGMGQVERLECLLESPVPAAVKINNRLDSRCIHL